MRQDLQGWAQRLVDEADWQPIHAELAFGIAQRTGLDEASRERPVEVQGHWLRGAIDWVEQHLSRGLRVVDHKTGRDALYVDGQRRSMELRHIAGGHHLQPLLYAAVTEAITQKHVESGCLYYCRSRSGFRRYEVVFDDEAKGVLQAVLQTINSAVQGGRLYTAPEPGACRICDYRPVCGSGRDEQPLKNGRDATTDALVQLRNTP